MGLELIIEIQVRWRFDRCSRDMFRLFDLSYNMENEKEKWANFRVYFKTLHQAMIQRERAERHL